VAVDVSERDDGGRRGAQQRRRRVRHRRPIHRGGPRPAPPPDHLGERDAAARRRRPRASAARGVGSGFGWGWGRVVRLWVATKEGRRKGLTVRREVLMAHRISQPRRFVFFLSFPSDNLGI
jgi:hypothetical protein